MIRGDRGAASGGRPTRRARGLLRDGGTSEPDPREDLLAAIALGKTVAFLIWSIPAVGLVAIAFVASGLGNVPDPWGSVPFVSGFLAVEAGLLWLVVRGRLPGTSAEQARPFSEKQLAFACHLLALGAWALAAGLQAEILHWVLTGFLLLGALVYLVTKSILSRRPRWAVLSVLAIPALQLAIDVSS